MPPPTTRDWLDGLRAFAIEHRVAKPLPEPPANGAQWAAERSILGVALATRLAEVEAIRQARRARGADADPAIVLTTSGPGMAAAEAVLGSAGDLAALLGDRLVAVTELEYRLWCIRCPDETFRFHVNLWNWIKTRLPPQRLPEFARYPLGPAESYWLHRTGIAGAGSLDRRDCHLWKWNGRHATLLEAFVTERAAPGL
ncbi:MAG: hypothetical protein K8S94_02135 [Planctomycetia bacterium]|nr:hypothetical protein [Planctomycetia bacterium]